MADIRTLDLNLLKAFDALYDEGSVTRAASRLALTQPAVSGMLARLRQRFGDPLFVRTQRGIVPTPRADALAGPVRQVLRDIGELLEPARFDPANAERTISLAATDYAQQVLVLPLLIRLRRLAPGLRLSVRPVQPEGLPQQLEAGLLDLWLTTPESVPEAMHLRELFEESYVCVMRKDHPAARRKLSLEQFCSLDHALVSFSGREFRGVTDEALMAQGRQRRVALSVASFLVLPPILRDTDLVAVVPRRLALRAEGLVIRQPPLPIRGFRKVLAWHERSHRDPALQWLREQLVEVARRQR